MIICSEDIVTNHKSVIGIIESEKAFPELKDVRRQIISYIWIKGEIITEEYVSLDTLIKCYKHPQSLNIAVETYIMYLRTHNWSQHEIRVILEDIREKETCDSIIIICSKYHQKKLPHKIRKYLPMYA